MTNRPTGQRFSLVYLPQGDLSSDNDTMRYRLAKLIEKEKYQALKRNKSYAYANSTRYVPDSSILQRLVEEEIGRQFTTFIDGISYKSWVLFLRKIPIEKVLDTITVVFKKMMEVGRQDDFIQQANRIFREENIAYEVDEEGGVHPVIDAAFAANIQSSIAGLAGARYALSLQRINAVDAALLASPPDYIQAIREVFGANENLFKLMYGASRLDAKSAREHIGRSLQTLYTDHRTMQRASAKILASFEDWIDAAHNYRHEQGTEAPNQPDECLALIIISEGLSYVRWLATIDKTRE